MVKTEFLRKNRRFQLTEDTNLIEEYVVDSLGIFILISFIEERFEIAVEPDEVTFENFHSIRAIADFIRSSQAQAV